MQRIGAFLILLFLSPLLILLSLLQLLFFRRIFFTQTRVGKHERLFRIYKFQSMVGGSGSDKERLTTWGRILRSTSVDELPQLWNIIRGEMNFIGPRPLLPEYLKVYSENQKRRHEVKPGITGWAQVNGRNILNWKQQFEFDVWYVDNRSFWLDLKIILLTFKRIWRKSADEIQLRDPFNGNN